jgi:flavin reductase (DIM6/NTAB) family NADH-FMN oxidoreductase RutF
VHVDPATLEGRLPYRLLTSLVVPRPIAWVSSLSADGTRNLAPHSYFNAISSSPLIVHFTSTGVKDSLRNVRATEEFVINIVSGDLVREMNITSADFPPEEDEFTWAGLEATPSEKVAPERVARAKAAFECRLNRIVSLGNGHMVFGDVVSVYVDDDLVVDGKVSAERLRPVARLGGAEYVEVKEIFEIPRPTWAELRAERERPQD